MPFFILLRLSDCVPGFAPVHANVGLHDCQLTFGRTEALLKTLTPPGMLLLGPGLMSLTRTVPASVPSLFHSSNPLVRSNAEKKTALSKTAQPKGRLARAPGSISLIRTPQEARNTARTTKPRRRKELLSAFVVDIVSPRSMAGTSLVAGPPETQ